MNTGGMHVRFAEHRGTCRDCSSYVVSFWVPRWTGTGSELPPSFGPDPLPPAIDSNIRRPSESPESESLTISTHHLITVYPQKRDLGQLTMIRSLLPVVQDANDFPPHPHSPYPTHSPDGSERYVPLHLTLADYHAACPPLGLLRPHVVEELLAHRPLNVEGQLSELTEAEDAGQEAKEAKVWQSFGIEGRVDCIYFDQAVLKKGPDGISAVMAEMVNQWKRDGKFSKPLLGKLCPLFPL